MGAVSEELPTLAKRVKALRDEHGGISLEDLAHEARLHGARPTFTGSELSRILRGLRPYTASLLSALATVLEVEVEAHFPEYRLAVAREMLDERRVGLEVALRNLAAAPALSRSDARTQLEADLAVAASRSRQDAAGTEEAGHDPQPAARKV